MVDDCGGDGYYDGYGYCLLCTDDGDDDSYCEMMNDDCIHWWASVCVTE